MKTRTPTAFPKLRAVLIWRAAGYVSCSTSWRTRRSNYADLLVQQRTAAQVVVRKARNSRSSRLTALYFTSPPLLPIIQGSSGPKAYGANMFAEHFHVGKVLAKHRLINQYDGR